MIADLPALELTARPLRKEAPALKVRLDAPPLTPSPSQPAYVPPTVLDLKPLVDGPMDQELLRRVVRRNLPQVRYCYEKSLQKTPELAGKVVLKLRISPEGTVKDSKIASSTLNDPEVEDCVAGRARTWAFPTSTAEVQVTYPFVMKWK